MGQRSRMGTAEVTAAEAAASEGQPQSQHHTVLYKHSKALCLSLANGKSGSQIYL